MPSVPKELIEHSLNVNPTATPKKQRLRRFSAEKREAIKKELANYSRLGSSRKFTIPSGWRILSSSLKRTTTSGGCASITQTSTSIALRIPLGSPHRPSHRLDGRMRTAILPGLLLGLSSNSSQGRRPDQNGIHPSFWRIQDHVLWTEECWSDLSARHTVMLHQTAPLQRGSLRR